MQTVPPLWNRNLIWTALAAVATCRQGQGRQRSSTATNQYEHPKPKNLNKRATAQVTAQALSRSAGRLTVAASAACRRPQEAQGSKNRHRQRGFWRQGTSDNRQEAAHVQGRRLTLTETKTRMRTQSPPRLMRTRCRSAAKPFARCRAVPAARTYLSTKFPKSYMTEEPVTSLSVTDGQCRT